MEFWEEPKKYWIKFSELYPCINNDMIEIYLKHIKKLKDDEEFGFKSCMKEKMDWFIRHKKMFYFMDQRYNYSAFLLFQKYIQEENNLNMFSIPIYCNYSRLKIIVDMIITGDVLKKLFRIDNKEYKYYCVCMIPQENINEYNKFKATFISKILRKYQNICTDIIYFLSLSSNKIIPYTINKKYLETLLLYCKRFRNILNYGHLDDIYFLGPSPSHKYLYPNMKHVNSSQKLYQFKTDYAHDIHEITLLPKIPPTDHKYITSFMDVCFPDYLDKLLISDHDKDMIKNMISLYKDPIKDLYIQDVPEELILNDDIEFYVDFETLPFGTHSLIYWIGVYSDMDGYKYFMVDKLDRSDELKIMTKFFDYVSSFRMKYKILYWHAEIYLWEKSMSFHNKTLFQHFDNWIDLCRVFRDTPILIKNCFNFKLKTIAHHLKKSGHINISCPDECKNGKESMDIAKSYYKTRNNDIKQKLHDYNHFDCVVMFEILQYLRKNI